MFDVLELITSRSLLVSVDPESGCRHSPKVQNSGNLGFGIHFLNLRELVFVERDVHLFPSISVFHLAKYLLKQFCERFQGGQWVWQCKYWFDSSSEFVVF